MKSNKILVAICGVLLSGACTTRAAEYNLFEFAYNIDGVVTSGANAAPAGVDESLFDSGTGLGTITVTLNSPGNHYVSLFVDHEIDQAFNTYFNEIGQTVNLQALSQSWEVDEPGFGPNPGDIYDNFQAGTLDNSIGFPGTPEDVSMAIGWSFVLNADEQAIIQFVLSDTAPLDGFYIEHIDPDSDAAVYFSSTATILAANPPNGVPDAGGAFSLLAVSLVALRWMARRQLL